MSQGVEWRNKLARAGFRPSLPSPKAAFGQACLKQALATLDRRRSSASRDGVAFGDWALRLAIAE